MKQEAMSLDPAIREQAARTTSVLVDGIPVDPWLVQVELGASCPTGHPIKLRLGIPILLFELKQSLVSVTASDLVRFVEKDIKDYPGNALTGYLVIARHVVEPLPAKRRGWFARVFTRYQAPLPHPPKWNWTTVENVTLRDDDTLAIRGICVS